MVQVARRSASVLKRRKSRNRMENAADRNQDSSVNNPSPVDSNVTKSEVDGGDVVFYMEEPQSGRRTRPFMSQNSSVTEAPDEVEPEQEADEDVEPARVTQLTEAHRNAIRAIRKIKYFVARRKFQQARKPYDVRDVIEQYSQGHLNMMVRIKELQRRLDQTLGKPGSYYGGSRVGHQKPMTVGARLYRVEQQLSSMDKKLDQIVNSINHLSNQNSHKMSTSISQTQFYQHPLTLASVPLHLHHQHAGMAMTSQQLHLPAGPSQASSPIPNQYSPVPNLHPHLEDDV